MISLINLPSIKDVKKYKRKSAPIGSKTKPVYDFKYDEKYGCPRRVIKGVLDLDEYIQQCADDIDFKALGKMIVDTRDNVVSHFTMEGEMFDQTALPRDVRELESLYKTMYAEFDKLPSDVKALFGDDFNQFKTSWMNGSIGNVLDAYYKSLTPAPTTSEEGETK